MIKVALTLLTAAGCSAVFMEKIPSTHRPGMPVHCTASKGFAAWDGVLGVVHGLSAIAMFGSASDATEDTRGTFVGIGVANGVFALGHVVSAISGTNWADQCRETREAERPTPTLVVSRPPAKPAASTKPKGERKVVTGEKPLHCATTAEDVGQCFLSAETCAAELEKAGASACEVRNAGSCFNATKMLDGVKQSICAVSIKDCEARRGAFAADPDYTVTPCGIYRASAQP